jgi:hypothetical protein
MMMMIVVDKRTERKTHSPSTFLLHGKDRALTRIFLIINYTKLNHVVHHTHLHFHLYIPSCIKSTARLDDYSSILLPF